MFKAKHTSLNLLTKMLNLIMMWLASFLRAKSTYLPNSSTHQKGAVPTQKLGSG